MSFENEASAEPAAMNGTAAEGRRPSPEMMEKLAEMRGRLQLKVGQVVLAMMNLPRYRHLTLADLNQFVLDPLMADRVAIASTRDEDGHEALAGIAIWAGVSDEVDAKIAEQVKAGLFPIRLSSEDWASGDKVWLLDVVAANRKAATAVLANFRQIAGDRGVRIHPIVARSVDPALIERLRAKAASAPAAEPPESEPQA